MTTVYWGHFIDPEDKINPLALLLFEPEPVLPQVIKRRGAAAHTYTLCPAFQDYYRNTYVVRCPVDITLSYDAKADYVSISPQGQEFYDYFVIHRGVQKGEDARLLLSLSVRYLFIADKACLIEQLPVSMHDANPNLRLICGTFDIAKWYRPIEVAFELLTDKLVIKRGDPLFYVRFIPKDSKKVALVHKDYTEKETEIVHKCVGVKKGQLNVGLNTLYELAERFRPSLWFNKKKCPFNWGKK